MAGGSPWAIGAPGWAPGGAASAGVRYQNTSHAKQGDRGSQVLPAAPSGTTWKAGELAEVSWTSAPNTRRPISFSCTHLHLHQLCVRTVRTNHGGGYQWRIAPASGPLTEATFQKTPLPFEGKSSLRWGGKTGKQMYFDATYVSEGTTPAGSTWAMNPLREPNVPLFHSRAGRR